MKVAELTAYHVRIPLIRPVRHASHARTSTDNLVVRCVLNDGTEGFGEGVPREYVTGETIDSTIALLRGSDLPAQMGPCADFRAAVELAERLRLAAVPGDDRGCAGNAARCAVELALLDAAGRHFREPLSRVVPLVAPDLYKPEDQVRYSGVILSARTALKLFWSSLRVRVYRFRQVKVKVGIEGSDDVYRLRSIRRWLRRWVDLRIDANEAWPVDKAAERIRELEPFRITSVEQPVPHAEVGKLAEVRQQIRTPIMLDESLCSIIDAERAIAGKTCDLFNIRLSKCGGFIPSLRLVQFARRHGLGCQLGCQVGETALLSAAGRHFAGTVGGLRYLEGSYDRHLVRESLGTRDITFGWGGKAAMLSGPGLGVDIDPAALERVTVRKEAILDEPAILTHTVGDGYVWKYRRYSPPVEPRGRVVCIHGIQSHGGWYDYSCRRLSEAGYEVSFLDRRGSGMNEQDRGDAPSFRRLLDDIAEFLQHEAQGLQPLGLKRTFLIAISWGGKLAVALQRRHPGLVDALALLCPGFRSLVRPPFRQRLGIIASYLFAPRRLFPVPLNDPELFTASPEWQQFLRDDPLAVRQATARLLGNSVRLDGYLCFVRKYVTVPVLLMLAGQDRIIDNVATRRFVESFATADKTVLEYPEAHHTLEFEPRPHRYLDDLIGWLDRHATQDGPR